MRQLLIIMLLASTLHIVAQNEVRLAFAGEVNVGNNYGSHSEQPLDVAHLFAEVSSHLKAADVAFGTLGTVLIDIDGTPNRANLIGSHKLTRVSEEYSTALREAGFTALNLANSHVADFGIEGLQTTMNSMRRAEIEFAGLKAMHDYHTFERSGTKYGFIAFGTSIHTLSMADSTLIHNMVAGLADQCDIVVVAFSLNETMATMHTSHTPTRTTTHMQQAVSFAHTCVNAGADIVYGNGFGQPLPIELYKDRLIIYDLGNFCTPYGTSYTGGQGTAPLADVRLFADGTFKSAKINSFKQTGSTGPVADNSHEAARVIKALTERHFPDTELKADDDGTITSTSESAYALAMRMLSEAERHRGKRYQMGSTGPNTFDCSGFTSYVFAKFGIKLERMAAAQYTQGHSVDKKDLRPGDLVFFTRSSVRGVGHVGIVYSVDKRRGSFKFIHASVSKGITIDDFGTSAYYIKRYVGARRILPD